jgi:hypothetical protein
MTKNYPQCVLVTLYCILLLHFNLEVLGKKNVKSLQETSWDKVASGVKVTSLLFIPKNLTANHVLFDFKFQENEMSRLGQQRRPIIIKCCGKKKCYSNLKGNRKRNDSRKVCK